mmetsp:Transcript_105844/g.242371  ORF Transcript_105844/g.242371 Transcript_105844/m.242371 type:complete len:88 (-) Transcript_105844:113-376(-)
MSTWRLTGTAEPTVDVGSRLLRRSNRQNLLSRKAVQVFLVIIVFGTSRQSKVVFVVPVSDSPGFRDCRSRANVASMGDSRTGSVCKV